MLSNTLYLRLLQVEMYFPESGHPAFGIFRAIVKDSTDVNHGAASVVGLAPCCFPWSHSCAYMCHAMTQQLG